MAPHSEIHARLLDRALELARRLGRLESECEHQQALAAPGGAIRDASPALSRVMLEARDELERIEDTLHRMGAGTFGVCAECGAALPRERLEAEPHALRCVKCAEESLDIGSLEHVRAQHFGLRRYLLSLGELIAQLAEAAEDPAASPEPTGAVVALLADLESELAHHFALEEKGGYLAEALAAAPQLGAQAAALQEQHPRLRSEIAELAEQARRAGPASPEWPRIDRRFQTFAELLLAHEDAENEIISRAWLEDESAGG